MKTVEIKFTKNGKNYAIKNLPVGPEGRFSKILGTKVRFYKHRRESDHRMQKYPEVMVNGKWMDLHIYVVMINGVNVPKGHNRHHIDMNPLNNTLSNIAIVDKNEHLRLHHKHDIENGKATKYENIYQIPSGGFKYLDLDADDDTIWKYERIFSWKLPDFVRRVERAGIKVVKK